MNVYTRIDEVPLDRHHGPDQGDSRTGEKPAAQRLLAAARKAAAVPAKGLVIPFRRVIRLGSRGKDVVGVKRALSQAGYIAWRPSTFTPLFGPFAARALRSFQHDHMLPATGAIDEATLPFLAPFFDAYAYLLYVGHPPGSTVRDRIVAYAFWGYNHRDQIGYLQLRPMSFMDDLWHLPVDEDCSTFATKSHKAGGAGDPNGESPPYNGEGYTGTLIEHGAPVTIENAKPGDLVFYSRPDHVAVYVGFGRVVSHGSAAGPYVLSATYRKITAVRTYLP